MEVTDQMAEGDAVEPAQIRDNMAPLGVLMGVGKVRAGGLS